MAHSTYQRPLTKPSGETASKTLISFPTSSGIAPLTHTASPALQSVLDRPPSTLPLRLTLGGLGFMAIFGTWAWFGQINEVAQAQGKLVPKGEAYKVNPIETGKVSQVMVKEGSTVEAGQVLMELDNELAQHEIERFEKDLSAANTELIQTRTLLNQAKMQEQIQSSMAHWGTQAQVFESGQGQTSIRTTEAVIAQLKIDSVAQQERLDRLKPLVEAGAIAREQVFQLEQGLRDRQRTITEHEGMLAKSLGEVDRLSATLEQKREEENKTKVASQQQSQQLEIQLSQIQAKIAQSQTLVEASRTKLKQRFIYSPVSGVVSNLKVRHDGEVVQPGQPIAEISPKDQPLILSTLLPNQEAGFVKLGMSVQVKLDAYPFQEYGIIPGKVIAISPDTETDHQRGQVYRVEVQIDQKYITKDGQRVPFKSGQTATAEIVTRQRRIADLLLDPIKQLRSGINL
jgi:hemolysin D